MSIVTGFLGSGKTTFLNWLLSQPGIGRVAVIVNEFGEIGLDHLLIATPVENIRLIEGGCLCCEVRGDLVETLEDLQHRRRRGEIGAFDHVMVETTGLSNPIPIIQTVLCDEAVRDLYRLSTVITLVDAVNGRAQMRSHVEAIRQAAVADVLLVSKTDLVDSEEGRALRSELKSINPGAVPVEARHGRPEGGAFSLGEMGAQRPEGTPVSAADLLSGDRVRGEEAFLRWLQAGETQVREARRAAGRVPFLAGAGGPMRLAQPLDVETFSVRRAGEIPASGMVMWLNLLATMKGEHLLRLKAILNVEGRPVAIHAAQTIVHEPVRLDAWPAGDRDSRFVVISRGSIRRAFERSLEQLDLWRMQPSAGPGFDPRAYRRFLGLAHAFAPGSAEQEQASRTAPS